MTDLVRTFESSPQFLDFTSTELEELAAASRPCSFSDGEELLTEGARAEGLYFVLGGKVGITRLGADGRRHEIGAVGPGELLGLVGLVENTRRGDSAVAVGPVEAALLPRATFTILYESDAPVSLKFQMLVARQLAADARELNAALAAVLAGQAPRPGSLGAGGLPDTD